MRILLINKYHYLKGGAERAYLDMGEILTGAGHEVAYFAMEDPQNKSTAWSKFFVSSVDYHVDQSLWQKLRTASRILWNSEANTLLQALIDEFRPDIAHAHNIYHQLSPSIFHVLKKNAVPIVLTLHDYKIISPSYTLFAGGKIWEHTSGIRAIWDRVVDGSYMKSAICASEQWLHTLLGSYALVDVLISPSQFLADECRTLGLTQTVTVLPNPLLHVPTNSQAHTEGKIVFVGRLSREKGVDELLQALAEYAQDKHLHIIGSGPEETALKQRVEDLGLGGRVEFRGSLYGQELDREVMMAEALIVPSVWYENLPYVVTENQARGVVVIASASGGITERITDGVNGFLFPIGDVEALGKILEQLNTSNLEAIRAEAIASTEDLAPQSFLPQLESLYQSLLTKD